MDQVIVPHVQSYQGHEHRQRRKQNHNSPSPRVLDACNSQKDNRCIQVRRPGGPGYIERERETRKFPVVILRKSHVVGVVFHIWSASRCQVPNPDDTIAFCCNFIRVGALPPCVHVLLRIGAVRVDSFFFLTVTYVSVRSLL